MTLNRNLFHRDPLSFAIPNDGVSTVGTPTTANQWQVLRYELESFVCEGEYARGLQRILSSYLTNLDRSIQPAVWVSGFYGSGKSHLLRVLEHLWRNTRFPDGASARSLVRSLDSEVSDSLKELDTIARRQGGTPWAAAGGMDAASVHNVNTTVLGIVLEAAGLPAHVAPAQVVLWLRREGLADTVAERLRAAGTDLVAEARQFNLSVRLAQAILAERPDIALDPRTLLKQLGNQFIERPLATSDTVELLREVLSEVGGAGMPPILIVVDEVQQYIGDSSQLALEVQGLAQALTSQFDGRVLFVATGQQELTATPGLQQIRDRFTVKAHLENQDIDEVVRRLLLQKRPAQLQALTNTLDQACGEIGRQLQGATLRPNEADLALLTRDYPLLPARRRFWESVLRAADEGGRAGQLRSQLRVVHEANRSVAEEPIGTVVGADFLYDQKSADLNASGKLPPGVQLLIAEQAGHVDDGPLRARVLAVLHLIALLPTEGPADQGVRASAPHVADLLVRNLEADGAQLRRRVPVLLETMAREGVVQQDADRFVIQTTEGRAWNDDFRSRRAALSGDTAEIAEVRDRHLRAEIDRQVPVHRIQHGESKVSRTIDLQVGDDPPVITDKVPVWVLSEWNGWGPRQFADLTRGAGHDSSMVYVYVHRLRAAELNDAVLDLRATEQVLQTRPTPTTA